MNNDFYNIEIYLIYLTGAIVEIIWKAGSCFLQSFSFVQLLTLTKKSVTASLSTLKIPAVSNSQPSVKQWPLAVSNKS